MKLKDLVPDVEQTNQEFVPGNMYDSKEVARAIASTKIVKKTVVIKNNSTGEIIGKKIVITK